MSLRVPANPSLRRIRISELDDRLQLVIPTQRLFRFLGFGSLLLVSFSGLLSVANLWALFHEDAEAAPRVGASVVLFLLLNALCPWWWFLGAETLDLTPRELRHEAGFAVGRKRRVFLRSEISDLRRSRGFRLGGGYQIRFHCTSVPGLPQFIGRQLKDDEVQPVIEVILRWQASR